MIPGKLYQFVGSCNLSLLNELFQYTKDIQENEIVLAIECLDGNKWFRVLAADGKIGNMYYLSKLWNEV